MANDIVFEGWLTKSPPTKRIWRTKWRRRWFALRQSGELPGQYFLDYYADRNSRRLKGTINLDLCEQVDAGLHMERSGTGSLDPKLRGSVFTIQTHSRTYHLEADCEAEMGKWVDAICRVCGLRPADEPAEVLNTDQNSIPMRIQNSLPSIPAMDENNECAQDTGPYIPIYECMTGVRAQEEQRAFTFDPKNIVSSTTQTSFDNVVDNRAHQLYTGQPHIRLNNAELSETESNSDEECKPLNASQTNIREWPVGKSFTRLASSPRQNAVFEQGPPVPPRPPKTFAINEEAVQKATHQIPREQEPIEMQEFISSEPIWARVPRRKSHGALPSPGRAVLTMYGAPRYTNEIPDYSAGQLSLQYSNLPSLPPAVDRALKPRYYNYSRFSHLFGLSRLHIHDDMKADTLHYLDLDLHTSKPVPNKAPDALSMKIDIAHGKSMYTADADSAYKTVDFLKTEAFNITRQDAEASRNNHH